MELRQVRYVVAVAEELHFRRAAERLKVAQPPLSRGIREIEAELGVQLFHRTRRKVELTEAGALLLPEMRRLINQAGLTALVAGRAMRGEIGLLHIGTTSSLPLMSLLPDVLGAYRKAFPSVQLVLKELNTRQQIELLETGELDLGFVRLPARIQPSRVSVETMWSEPIVVALHSDHPLASAKVVGLRRLAGDPVIMYPHDLGGGLYDVTARLLANAGFAPRIEQEARTVPMAVSLAAAGLGFALVPGSARSLQIPGVVYRPLRAPDARTEIALAFRRNDRSPRVIAFVRLCRSLRPASARPSRNAVKRPR